MGCSGSKHPAVGQPGTPGLGVDDVKISGLSSSEIQLRIEASEEGLTATIGGIYAQYGWVSQRGYYPDGAYESGLPCPSNPSNGVECSARR
jgi:hypothetical protein